MNHLIKFSILGCVVLLMPRAPVQSQVRDSPRVLVFSKTMGYRHASIEPGVEAIRQLGNAHGFEVTHTEDASVFNTARLSSYDVVLFLSTTGDVLDEAQQQALTAFIRNGGGYVGVHAASDTEYDWPWYGSLVGAYFTRHPSDPNVREGSVTVNEAWHNAPSNLPVPWIRTDEWYEFRDFDSTVTVWLDIDERSYKQPDESPAQTPRPIAWSHRFDGGRAFYTAMGHTVESYAEPLFLEHLWLGIQYALGADS